MKINTSNNHLIGKCNQFKLNLFYKHDPTKPWNTIVLLSSSLYTRTPYLTYFFFDLCSTELRFGLTGALWLICNCPPGGTLCTSLYAFYNINLKALIISCNYGLIFSTQWFSITGLAKLQHAIGMKTIFCL